jgi:hypothetical protein
LVGLRRDLSGTITADAFWLKVGLSPSLEDDYLRAIR